MHHDYFSEPPLREKHEREKNQFDIRKILIYFVLIAVPMLFLSAVNLQMDVGVSAKIKALLIALGGGLTSYTILHLTTTIGADLAARGYRRAKISSVLGISIVATGMFLSTYVGIVWLDIEARKLQELNAALVGYIQQENNIAARTEQLYPALSVIADEHQATWQCEIREGCIGHNQGGNGEIAKELASLARRSRGIAESWETGQSEYRDSLDDVNRLVSQFETVLSDNQTPIKERRNKLQGIHRNIEQNVAKIRHALRVPLVAAYAQELQEGVKVANHHQANKRINAMLKRQGNSLRDILDSLETQAPNPPAFVSRLGVADTLRYLPDYASIAAILFVIEFLGLPIWLFAYLQASWRIERRLPPSNPSED